MLVHNKQRVAASRARRMIKNLSRTRELYWFVLPAVVVVFLFNYMPMYGVQLAFREFDPRLGLTGGAFAGLKYFNRFFNSFQFWTLIRNTVCISAYNIVVGFPFPVMIALLMRQIRGHASRKFMQTVSYLPHFISTVVLVSMLYTFCAPNFGLIGNLLRSLGMEAPDLMGDPDLYYTMFVFSGIWQEAGWVSILYLSALSSIDREIIDAAHIDGAGAWQCIWHIDLPHLIPTMVTVLILSSGSIMNVGFEKAYLMQNALNISRSEVISTYVYKVGLISNQYSYSAAIGLFNSVINFGFLAIVNLLSSKAADISLW